MITFLISFIFKSATFLAFFILLSFLVIKLLVLRSKLKSSKLFTKYDFSIAFFHPFCNSGGGGERVLWSAVKIIQDT